MDSLFPFLPFSKANLGAVDNGLLGSSWTESRMVSLEYFQYREPSLGQPLEGLDFSEEIHQLSNPWIARTIICCRLPTLQAHSPSTTLTSSGRTPVSYLSQCRGEYLPSFAQALQYNPNLGPLLGTEEAL